jgi:hypothetical protein
MASPATPAKPTLGKRAREADLNEYVISNSPSQRIRLDRPSPPSHMHRKGTSYKSPSPYGVDEKMRVTQWDWQRGPAVTVNSPAPSKYAVDEKMGEWQRHSSVGRMGHGYQAGGAGAVHMGISVPSRGVIHGTGPYGRMATTAATTTTDMARSSFAPALDFGIDHDAIEECLSRRSCFDFGLSVLGWLGSWLLG